ncbi:50S ribosomal protein L25/general stress protein Ctc [Granulicoccus phenolivorans]|uniref:50S ribosomal protein L25/general stress protein Ctc n=1 Tax=Granulicoccus phenolivorans TaxID=266854 RepID=UPI00041AF6CD|nr:50S ribosomal protein L25/general stress protein Ctc [Granulicoccus phenolivorans]
MSDDLRLEAESRTEFGKGAARRIRRDKKVPAVMYGHGTDPVHITLPGHQTLLALRTANAVLTIVLDGKEQLALAKQVQRDPIKGDVEHVDLVLVRKGEKVTVEVVVEVTGEAGPDSVVVVEQNHVSLEVEATNIPESVQVSVEGLTAGSQITVADLVLPAGATPTGEPTDLVVNITHPQAEEPAEAPEAAEGTAAAEGSAE